MELFDPVGLVKLFIRTTSHLSGCLLIAPDLLIALSIYNKSVVADYLLEPSISSNNRTGYLSATLPS